MDAKDILLQDLEKGVRLGLPTAVHRYLGLKTEFTVCDWEYSPASFKDKWRLARLIIDDEANYRHIISVMKGGIIYPMGGKDPVPCPECGKTMSQIGDDLWICTRCGEIID